MLLFSADAIACVYIYIYIIYIYILCFTSWLNQLYTVCLGLWIRSLLLYIYCTVSISYKCTVLIFTGNL